MIAKTIFMEQYRSCWQAAPAWQFTSLSLSLASLIQVLLPVVKGLPEDDAELVNRCLLPANVRVPIGVLW